MPKGPGSDVEGATKCFLCGEEGANYTTMVLINDGHANVGDLEVSVHMSCLLQKGGTFWTIPDTPHLQGKDIPVEALPYEEARRRYIRDAREFERNFPELAAELRQLKEIARRAAADKQGCAFAGQGRCVWYGVERPVDLLCALRKWWANAEPQLHYLAYEQPPLLVGI